MTANISTNHAPADDTQAIIRKLSLVSIIGNTLLSGFKIFAGIVGHSNAMISDAIHSFSDVLTTIIAYFGVKISQKNADRAHPYGHERIECISSMFLGMLLLVTGFYVGKAGVENIISAKSTAVPGAIALIAALLSIVSKEAMYWYTRYYAKKIQSTAFMADAWHHRSDAFSSVGSLIGIAGAMMGVEILDSIASVIICLFIIKVSYDILKDAISKLLDTSCSESYEAQLCQFIKQQPGVQHVDVLHTRMFGSKVYIDLEIQVDGSKHLRESHAIADQVHNNVEKNFPNVKHIMIHVNPAENSNQETVSN